VTALHRTQPLIQLTPGTTSTSTLKGRPLNILFILSDQERGWHLFPDGFHDRHTPARRWLRERGVMFERCLTPSPICSTARGMIYSGMHAMNNGVFDNVPLPIATPLRKDIPTMGSIFADMGYITGYAGKWHLSRIPDEALTDEMGASANAEIRSYGFMETDLREETDGAITGWKFDGRTVDQACGFVRRRASEDKPWLLAVNLLNPHDIMFYTTGDAMTASRVSQFPDVSARPPFEDPLYTEDLGYELTENYGMATAQGRPRAVDEWRKTFDEVMGWMPFDDLDAGREMQNYYWNCVRDSDRHLAKLLQALTQSGQLDNTIIVFTSDHGEMLGTHGARGKGTTAFRESATIPAVIVHPGGRKGESDPVLMSHIDWLPTLVSLAGVPAEQQAEQLPLLVGADVSAHVFSAGETSSRNAGGILLHWTSLAYVEHRNIRKFDQIRQLPQPERLPKMMELMGAALENRSQMRGVFDGRWKFQRYGSPLRLAAPRTFEELQADWDFDLYDTHADPGEVNNLVNDVAQWQDTVMTLNARVNELIDVEVGEDNAHYNPMVQMRKGAQ
jgi:arylsulfatase A-like enzyme